MEHVYLVAVRFNHRMTEHKAMVTIIVVVLGLLVVNFASLCWRCLREARGLSEYAQHLLLKRSRPGELQHSLA
jgi:hypothetical protein